MVLFDEGASSWIGSANNHKQMKQLLALLSCIAIVLSCVHEVEESCKPLVGDYVLSDGSGLSDTYVSFNEWEITCYSLSHKEPCTLANDTLWHTKTSDFIQKVKGSYTLSNGNFSFPQSSPFSSGKIKDGSLTLDGELYTQLRGFSDKYWSSIIIPDGTTKKLDYTSQEASIPIVVNNPIAVGEISVSTSYDWINDLRVKDGVLSFQIPEVKTDTSGTIEVNYTNAEPLLLTVNRCPATSILTEESERTISYSSSQEELAFVIDNPVKSSILSVSCDQSWVENVQVLEDRITFSVQENNSENTRFATLALSYGGARDVVFKLTQTWSSSEIIIPTENQELTYEGGTFSFDVSIVNPREGVSITAQSQSDWITDVIVSGNTVNYKVLNNNSYYSRSGGIKIMYGSFASVIIPASQSSHPITTFVLNTNTLDLLFSEVVRLYVTVFPEDVPILWSSDDETVASVVPAGYVTARGSGRATITAKSSDNSKRASCLVNVTTPVTGITLDKSSLEMMVGDSESLSATITPSFADNKEIIWASDNPSVAIVDQNGLVSAISPGSADIIARTLDGNLTAKCHLSVFTIVDLSLSESANCYIVPAAGWYKFKTVRGNSSVYIEDISTVETLWESSSREKSEKGIIIRSVEYAGGYITFSTPLNMQNGNAVIAAKNSEGTILWSWHIWVFDNYYPDESAQTYYNNAGVMMDRNLGAISASGEGSIGLKYQWGRKDPFPSWVGILRTTEVGWPEPAYAGPDGIEYSIKNPMTIIRETGTFYYNNEFFISNYDIVSTDNEEARWSPTKTIYDPCPPGWHVPDGGESGVWARAAGSTTANGVRDDDHHNYSKVFGEADPIWYPYGEYWSCTQCLIDPSIDIYHTQYRYYGAYVFYSGIKETDNILYQGKKTQLFDVRCKKDD